LNVTQSPTGVMTYFDAKFNLLNKYELAYSTTSTQITETFTPDIFLSFPADGSPRLGKVRKFHKDLDVVPFASNESGFEAEIDGFDTSLSVSANEQEEIARLQAKVAFLEQILVQHSIPVPSENAVVSQKV
jgi:hypothetical protein